jgi:hypothetical protein
MNDSNDDILPTPQLRILQMNAGVLVMCVLVFLACYLYEVFVRNGGLGQAPAQGLPLSLIAVGVTAVGATLSILIPGIMTRTALKQIVAGTWQLPRGAKPDKFTTVGAKLLALRRTTLIVELALLEGPAFFGCFAYGLQGEVLALGAAGVAILLMLMRFPTDGHVRAWLERQAEALAALEQEKDLAMKSQESLG